MTATASNIVTNGSTTDDLMVVVSTAKCRPPEVTIPLGSTSNLAPTEFMRSEMVTTGSLAKLNCSDVVSTR